MLISSIAIAQSSLNKNRQNIDEIVNKAKIDDTIKVNLKKKSTIIPVKTQENTKLIMVKETVEADYLKYVFPVFTLILGIFLNKLIDFISSKKNIKRNGKTWTAELIGFEASLNSQKEALNNFKDTFNGNNYDIPNLKIYGGLDGKNFESLAKGDLLKYIESKYAGWKPSIFISNVEENENFKKYVKATNKIIGYIDIVKFNFNIITEKHSSFLNGISTNTSILNKHLHNFRDELAQYHIELELESGFNGANDPRLRPINILFKREIMDKMTNGLNINPLELPANFCQPILSTLSVTRDDVRTYSLRTTCTAILNTVEAIKAEREYMKTNLVNLIRRFEESIENLPEIIILLNAKTLSE